MTLEHKIIVTEGLAPCPLCGTEDIQMVVDGKLWPCHPFFDAPWYQIRCVVKCPREALYLGNVYGGSLAVEGRTDNELLSALDRIMCEKAEEIKALWNRRAT